MKGKKRCKLHGGASTGAPKGNTNALKHGLYSDALLPGEEAIWAQLFDEIGKLDQEITIMRLRLRRMLILQRQADMADMPGGDPAAALQIQGVSVETSNPHPITQFSGKVTTVTKGRRDYAAEIRQTAKTIAEMEQRRATLLAGTGGLDPGQAAREIAEALQVIDELQEGVSVPDSPPPADTGATDAA